MRQLRWVVLLGLVAAVAAAWVYGFVLPFGPQTETFVEVAPGTGSARIAAELEAAGVIRSRWAFAALREWLSISGAPGKAGTLKAGEYRFDHPETLAEVYETLRRGEVYTVTVVVPEGFNIFDVADAVAHAGLAPRDEFLQAARSNTQLIERWSPGAASLEGYLFPDTYRFSRHATPQQMLATMVRRFGQKVAPLHVPADQLQRVVTLASLVEKEVSVSGERPKVASVFENRLAAGMPLQTDPSVIYGSVLRGTWTGVVHQSELHSDSAYNTYAHTGLPPGPICNPGMASLQAALHPAQTSYLYFVADAQGATRFATTLAEHQANVAAYRAATR